MSSSVLVDPIKCASDFCVYLDYALDREQKKPMRTQHIVCEFLTGVKKKWRARKKVCLGARGFTKTYIIRRLIEWRWLRRPETQVVVQSANDAMAGQVTDSVLQTLLDDPLFARIQPARPLGSLQFTLEGYKPEKGHSIRCAGIRTSITGQRADLYVFDDPEPDNQPEAEWERIIAAMEEARLIIHPVNRLWHGKVPPPEQTQLIVTGQPHWTGTAYVPPPVDPATGELPAHPLRDAIFLKIPALCKVKVGTEGSVPHSSGRYAERSNMPLRFTSEELVKMRDSHEISPPRWRLQMEIDCTPMEGEGSVIKVSQLPTIRRPHWDLANLTAVVDPADSVEACEWGVAVGGTAETQIHVLDLMGFHGQVVSEEGGLIAGERVWEEIFDYCDQMGVSRIYLEKNLQHAAMAARRLLRRCKVKAQVYEYSASVNKLTRIVNALDHPCATGMISFEPHILQDPVSFRQLAELRYVRLPKVNDRLDALAGLVNVFLEQPTHHGVKEKATRVVNTGRMDYRPSTFRSMPFHRNNPFRSLRRSGP